MRALVYLSLCQIKNAVRTSISSPTIWIPLLFIVLMFPTRSGSLLLFQDPLPPDIENYLALHLEVVHASLFIGLSLLALGYLDTGFSGGALKFSPSDVAVLFPAPLSRRLVLLFKLPSALFQHVLILAALGWITWIFVLLPLEARYDFHGVRWSGFFAAMLCVGGYFNLASILDLYSPHRRVAQIGHIFRLLCICVVVGIAYAVWADGAAVLTAIDHSKITSAIFYPCRIAVDNIMLPIRPVQLSGTSWVFLFGWFVVTLSLLLTRQVNYYEAEAASAERVEQRHQDYRSGNFTIFHKHRTRPSKLAISLPAFGRGSGSLVWAHLSAAAKRPAINFFIPLFGGAALVLLVAYYAPNIFSGYTVESFISVKIAVSITTGYYVFYAVVMLGLNFYQRALRRETLIRPLPLPMMHIVAADVGIRAILGSLFPIGEGLALLALHEPGLAGLAVATLFAVPAFIVCLNLISYRLALFYPNSANKVQNLVGSFIQLSSFGVLALAGAPFLVAPLLFSAPEWVCAGCTTFGLVLIAALLFPVTVRAASAFESSENLPVFAVSMLPRRFRKGNRFRN